MHSHSTEPWQHPHAFLGTRHDRNERRTWFVVAITSVMMIAEITGGSIFGSMALVADGWHMSTHAAALAIAALAYRFARSMCMIRAFRSAPANSGNWPALPAR
jgi:Co/Zn/Cd efflux system component